MASGTPVLTTKLPGMPKEYDPFVYCIGDESAGGVAAALREVLGTDERIRNEKGAAARSFVLQNKTNVGQAARVIAFLKTAFLERGRKA